MTEIDIISGFLGAGKTTLIRKLISEGFRGEKLVLIENEFGEIAIDGGFLADSGIQITEMNSGCICCSLVGDFSNALDQVMETYAPDRIIIEPSGVGKLSDVAAAVERTAKGDRFIGSMAAVCDAGKVKMYLKNFGEFYSNQIENASSIFLSRTDTVKPEKVEESVHLIREKNPKAPIVTTPWNELTGEQLTAALSSKDTLEDALRLVHEEAIHDVEEEHDHHHEEGHHHHHHHDGDHDADEIFSSWGVESPKTFEETELRAKLSSLDSEQYGIVLRAKGIVPAKDGTWLHFDYVPGEIDIRNGTAALTGRICVIGSELREDQLQALFMEG